MLKEVSVGTLIEKAFEKHAHRECIGDVGRYRVFSTTYAQLHDKVKRCRTLLEDHGLKEDDIVLLLGSNSAAWLTVCFACIQSGIIVVPLDVQSSPELVKMIQSEVKAKLFFNDRGMSVAGAKSIDLAALRDTLAEETSTERPPVKRVPGDLLEIVYTSGTTGQPKGVMLTHKNILANVESLIAMVRLPPGLRLMSVLPMSHMLQQVVGVLYPFVLGEKVFLPQTVLASRLAELIITRKIHALVCVPAVLESLRNHIERAGSSVRKELGWRFRLIGVGGAATPLELAQWWQRRGVKVVEGYGLTEAGPLVSLNTLRRQRLGTVGMPLPELHVKLGDHNEVLVKGDNVMKGYYKKPKETAATIRNGWLHTGDEGELVDGFLVIKGRIKDAIKTSGGLMVWPADVEAVLDKTQGVIESCVVEKGNKIHAVLILEDPKKAKDVIEKANKQLQANQRVATWSVWPEPAFPKTPTGKIRKFLVAQRLQGRAKPIARHQDPVIDIAQRALKTTLRPGDRLTHKGMDSLARVELVAALEQELGVEIEETALGEHATVAQLQKLVKEHRTGRARFPRWAVSGWCRLIRAIEQPIMRAFVGMFARTSCNETERLNGTPTPVIIIANHTSAWDAPLVISCLPPKFRKLAIPAMPDYVFGIPPVKNPFLQVWRRYVGWFVALHWNGYPFGPQVGVERSLRYTGELIDKGYSILIFPEGHRSRTGTIAPFEEGIGVLAAEMNIPIIPAKVSGLEHVLPAGKKIPRFGTCNVTFGLPVTAFPRMSTLEIAKQLEDAVRKL